MIRTYSTPHSNYFAVALDDADAERVRGAGLWLRGPFGPINQEPDVMPKGGAHRLRSGSVAAIIYGREVAGVTAYRPDAADPTHTDCQAERFLFGREEQGT